MQGITSLNVAVVGGGLPVDPIDIADFEAILGELSPAVKAPGAIVQAQGNQFTVVFLPHRASVQVDVPFPEGAEGKVLDAMRFYLKEYAGPRSVTGLGHNFSGELDSGGATGRHVVDSLLNKEKLNLVLNAEPGSASMTIQFVRGTETRCQLLLSVRDADAHVVDWSFNFHYDLRQPESLDVFDALDQFSASGRCRKRRARARRRTPRPGAHRVPTAIFLSILTTCVLPGIPDAHVLALRPLV